jgi:hypothetical protein
MYSRIKANTLAYISWLSFVLAVVATIATTYASSANVALLQHADFLYLPALYKDLVLEGGRIKDWVLPPTPYFFPDFAVYSVLRAIWSNQDWTAIAAQVLVPTSLALISIHIARQIGSVFNSYQTLALLSTMLLAYAWRWSGLAVGFLCLTIHSGQIVMVLACIALLLRPSAARVVAVCTISFATALSDPLFVMAGVLPMGYLIWQLAGGWARWVKLVSFLAANLGGLAVRSQLPVPAQPAKFFDSHRSAEALRAFAAHLGDFDTLPVYIGFGCAALALVSYWRDRQRRTVILALIMSPIALLFCLWLIGAEVVVWGSRYLISMHVILAILAPIGLNTLVKRKPFTLAFAVAIGASTVVAVVSSYRNLANIGTVRLAPMECFDRFALSHPVHRCVASYWFAKPIAVLASRDVTVLQTRPDGIPYRWINTQRHIREHANIDCAIFNESEAVYFTKRFGEPQSSVQCEGVRIMAYTGDGQQELNKRLLRMLH